jgi:uncharacterized protein YqgC (DUF456 family)
MFPGLMVLIVVLMILGIAGSVVPFMPGTPLILLGAFVHAWATGFHPIGGWRLLLLAMLTALSYALDYLSGALGARKLGGSRWAMLGALVGGIIGIFFGPFGIVLGPIIGAVGVELIYRKEIVAGLRSGAGTVLGMLLGAVAKLSIAVIMVGLFALWTFGE